MNNIQTNIREYHSEDYKQVVGLLKMFQIHLASIDSMKEVRAFTSEKAAQAYMEQCLKDIHEMNGICFVAEVDRRIIGFIQGIITSHRDDVMHNLSHHESIDGWIGLLYVHPSHRAKDIAKRLIACIQGYFTDHKCKTMRLKVMSDNIGAVEMYKKYGFLPKDIEMVLPLYSPH